MRTLEKFLAYAKITWHTIGTLHTLLSSIIHEQDDLKGGREKMKCINKFSIAVRIVHTLECQIIGRELLGDS